MTPSEVNGVNRSYSTDSPLAKRKKVAAERLGMSPLKQSVSLVAVPDEADTSDELESPSRRSSRAGSRMGSRVSSRAGSANGSQDGDDDEDLFDGEDWD